MNIDFWADALPQLGVPVTVADDWADTFARVLNDTEWSSPDDLPNFLGQVIHESARLTRLEENLFYSAERLVQVWPRRFPTLASAQPFARNPRALANKVYGGRLGNAGPDDGWRYRGRGLIQVTGLDNYALVEELTGMPVVAYPDLLLEQEPALRASAAWWEESVPDALLGDSARVTRVVNGGTHGAEERRRLTAVARQILEGAHACPGGGPGAGRGA